MVKSERGSCKHIVGKMITGATIQRNAEGFVTRGYNSNRYRAAAQRQLICENPEQPGWESRDGDKGVVIVPCAGQTQFRHLGPPSCMMGDLGWGMPPGEGLIPHPLLLAAHSYQPQTSLGFAPYKKIQIQHLHHHQIAVGHDGVTTKTEELSPKRHL